jgi:hypothetical protein
MIRATGLPVILASGVVLFSVRALAQSASPPATPAAPPAATASGSAEPDKDAPVNTDFQAGDVDLQVTGGPTSPRRSSKNIATSSGA